MLLVSVVFLTACFFLVRASDQDPSPVLSPTYELTNATEENAHETDGATEASEEPPTAPAVNIQTEPGDNADTAAEPTDNAEENTKKVIYLTFDDGPSARTPEILNILDKYNVKATFFVVHTSEANREYTKSAYERGHVIGLHTYSHKYNVIYSSETAFYDDLRKISDEVFDCIGERIKIMRFAGGSSNTLWKKYASDGDLMNKLVKGVEEKGYAYFDWNAQSNDSAGGLQTVERLFKSAISSGEKGRTPINMLMHDEASKKLTVEALPKIIEFYQSMGYEFCTLSQDSPVFHHSVSK